MSESQPRRRAHQFWCCQTGQPPPGFLLIPGRIENKGVNVEVRIRYSLDWTCFPVHKSCLHHVAGAAVAIAFHSVSAFAPHPGLHGVLDQRHGLPKGFHDHPFDLAIAGHSHAEGDRLRNTERKIVASSAIIFGPHRQSLMIARVSILCYGAELLSGHLQGTDWNR
jgi:hypothetical protein